MKNKIGLLVAVSAVLSSLLFSGVAFAQTHNATEHQQKEWHGPMNHMFGVFGTVTAVNGSIFTITSTNKGKEFDSKDVTTSATKIYTVDATNAKVTKNRSMVALTAVSVGDIIFVRGSMNGTTVTATTIRDGMKGHGMEKKLPMPQIQGNGQPVIGGTVTGINGSTLTITNKSDITYTVVATNATVLKSNVATTLSSVSIGDAILVQGTVNGTAVTASSIIDSGSSKGDTNATTSRDTTHREGIGGFFGSLGGFFRSMFRFF